MMDELDYLESRSYEALGAFRYEVRVRYAPGTQDWEARVTVFDSRHVATSLQARVRGTTRREARQMGQAEARKYIEAQL